MEFDDTSDDGPPELMNFDAANDGDIPQLVGLDPKDTPSVKVPITIVTGR
jgi:hypothetical protein